MFTMNQSAFIYLFIILVKYSYSNLSDQCMKSNTFWHSLKYPYTDSLKNPTSQFIGLLCPYQSSRNCCSSDMNTDMVSVSEIKIKENTEDKIESIVKMFSNDSYELLNLFLKDLDDTKNDLHQLFSTTYGYNYKMHKAFFFSWFEKLKLYMQGRVHNIGWLVDNFFAEMAEKIVQIIIGPGFKASTVACHTARLIESKPYQETDVLLKKKLLRSYPPARLLVNAMGVGRDAFRELMRKTAPSKKCVEEFNTVFHCMLCQGLTLKPCFHRCSSFFDQCFGSIKSSDFQLLDRSFSKFIKTIVQLATKLDNPFNFPEVNSKMNVQISSAIMNIQTMYPNIKDQIKTRCQAEEEKNGSKITRKRRQASPEFYKWQNSNNNENKQIWEQPPANKLNYDNFKKKDFQNFQSKSNNVLSHILRTIKQKYTALETYFRNQKTTICSSISVLDSSTDCWNGTAINRNTASETVNDAKTKMGPVNNLTNDPIIKTILDQLNNVTDRINSYLNDVNVDPETVSVQEYKLYVSRKINTSSENNPQLIYNQKIDGSGESELNKPPQSNSKLSKSKDSSTSQQPDKPDWEFPTLPEGSGAGGGGGGTSNKVVDDTTKKKKKKKNFSKNSNFTTSTPVSFMKLSVGTSTKSSAVVSNQIPDDEDLNPARYENVPKIISSTPIVPVILLEGSGNPPPNPDISYKRSTTVRSVTTTHSVGTFIDGSGDQFTPKQPKEKPKKQFPMLPDQHKSASVSPTKVPGRQTDLNPDEDVVQVDGSGRTPQISISPPIQPVDPRRSKVTIATTSSAAPVSPDSYPGKVPSEVWLPGLEGAKDRQSDRLKTTPAGSCPPAVARNDIGGLIAAVVLIVGRHLLPVL